MAAETVSGPHSGSPKRFAKSTLRKLTINWTIGNYSLEPSMAVRRLDFNHPDCNKLESHSVTNGDGISCKLMLYLSGRTDPNYIDFRVDVTIGRKDLKYYAVALGTIVGTAEEDNLNFMIPGEHELNQGVCDINKKGGWTSNKFISMKELTDRNLLVDDQLTIKCDVYYVETRDNMDGFDCFMALLKMSSPHDHPTEHFYPGLFNRHCNLNIICYDYPIEEDDRNLPNPVQSSGNQRIIPVHKSILANSSTVFAVMFSKCSYRFQEATAGHIVIDDYPYEVLKSMIGYIYYGKIEKHKTLSFLSLLLLVSDKYDLIGLKRLTCNLLYEIHLDQENSHRLLSLSSMANCHDLMKAIQIFRQNDMNS